MTDWRTREVENESRFRSANEAIEAASDASGHRPFETYICECSDSDCTAPIRLSRIEYETVRAEPVHFAIKTNHENPEVDVLVSEYERYSTVAKLPGALARLARDADPRRQVISDL